jgi:ABC-type sugar transport system permease subunit
LIIPYTIPGFISILIWVGLFNPHLGVISLSLEEWFGWSPAWFSDPFWAKVGILIVNLWLGYPYMMLVSSGALQSIPHEILEAARVDGANSWQCFWKITMPLLLMSVGPLLISSFAMNFNNFTVIYLYNSGGPPIPGTSTPAGYTDILISYTYRLAFASGRGSDYGYASAITIIIFIVVAAITLFNFRFTRVWEEVSENV